jgi:hypothetical protein
MNGSGKTTVGLTAIWACLKGIAEKSKNDNLIGERFRFIANGAKSADIELTLLDTEKNAEIIVKNKISDASNKITFQAPDDYELSNDWLNNLLSVAFLSTKNFTQLDSKQQALLLGINTEKFDNKIENLKNEYTLINRDLKNLGEIKYVEKVEKISISELIEKKNNLRNIYLGKDKFLKEIENTFAKKRALENELKEINNKIKEFPDLRTLNDEVNDIIIEAKAIDEKIKNSEEINYKALEYERFNEKQTKKIELEKSLYENKDQQNKIQQERLDYIQSFNLGFNDLSIDDKGQLLLKNRPIKEPHFSKGELELIVANLYVAKNPDLKVRFIDDFELLDEQHQTKLINDLLQAGFQIITAQVDNNKFDKKQDNIILLSEI